MKNLKNNLTRTIFDNPGIRRESEKLQWNQTNDSENIIHNFLGQYLPSSGAFNPTMYYGSPSFLTREMLESIESKKNISSIPAINDMEN